MSEPATEHYRLALIAHYAEKLAELLYDGKVYEESVIGVAHRYDIQVNRLVSLACYINNHLNKKETNK